MSEKFFRGFLCVVLILFISGCGYQAKRYVEIRERVDQNPSGNAGYLTGTVSPEEQQPSQTTRKVYVLEFTKNEGTTEMEEEEMSLPSRPVQTYSPPPRPAPTPQYVPLPPIEEPQPSSNPSFVEYKVEKDDTLQKISKKFYDSYSKWPKIYNANKDKIKNPNFLKEGLVIQVPME